MTADGRRLTAANSVLSGSNEGLEIVERGIVGEYEEFFSRACAGLSTRSNFQNALNSMRVAEAIENNSAI